MTTTRIIGIDPGFDRLGVAIVDKEGTKEALVTSLSILTPKTLSFEDRLISVAKQLEEVLINYLPHESSIETIFITKNQKTVIQVAEVRGVVIYLLKKHGVSIHEYSPPQIKVAVTGYGKASKEDVALMVTRILKIPPGVKKLDDELDAIAIALTHSAHRKTLSWK